MSDPALILNKPARVQVTLYADGNDAFIDDLLSLAGGKPAGAPLSWDAQLFFDILLGEDVRGKHAAEQHRHVQEWQSGVFRTQSHAAGAQISDSLVGKGKRRQLEMDFQLQVWPQAPLKTVELHLLRLLKQHFPDGSLALSWRATLADGAVWYGDTQFAYNLIQPGVEGLHPDVYKGLVAHFDSAERQALADVVPATGA